MSCGLITLSFPFSGEVFLVGDLGDFFFVLVLLGSSRLKDESGLFSILNFSSGCGEPLDC